MCFLEVRTREASSRQAEDGGSPGLGRSLAPPRPTAPRRSGRQGGRKPSGRRVHRDKDERGGPARANDPTAPRGRRAPQPGGEQSAPPPPRRAPRGPRRLTSGRGRRRGPRPGFAPGSRAPPPPGWSSSEPEHRRPPGPARLAAALLGPTRFPR